MEKIFSIFHILSGYEILDTWKKVKLTKAYVFLLIFQNETCEINNTTADQEDHYQIPTSNQVPTSNYQELKPGEVGEINYTALQEDTLHKV